MNSAEANVELHPGQCSTLDLGLIGCWNWHGVFFNQSWCQLRFLLVICICYEHFLRFPRKCHSTLKVISLKLKMSFDFSFTEQRNADDEETGEGKRGITYEVKKKTGLQPVVFIYFSFNQLFPFIFSFVYACLSFFEYVTFYCRFLRTRVLRPRRRKHFVTLV